MKTCFHSHFYANFQEFYEGQSKQQISYIECWLGSSVILLPAHPASFAHKFLCQRVPGCNNIADLSLKIVFGTHKFAVGLTDIGNSESQDP